MSPNLQFLVAYDIANTFSDLQLVTCLVVIVGGIKDLDDGSRISTYRFMIATDLALLCTLTHLPSLVVTRSVHGSVKLKRPRPRELRGGGAPRPRVAHLPHGRWVCAVELCLLGHCVRGDLRQGPAGQRDESRGRSQKAGPRTNH
ncbi:hypothetical protein LZ31DRAFT_555792 [Colletotrichum somersetense]|nr:hypothetical protein LZ31DRAFT_555792 [Colletotrichum somersetense]